MFEANRLKKSPTGLSPRIALFVFSFLVFGLLYFAEAGEPDNLPGMEATEERGKDSPELARKVRSLQKRLEQVVKQKRKLLFRHSDLYALARLKVEKASTLLERYLSDTYRDRLIQENLAAGEQILDALLKGKAPPLEKHGRLERAYLALNDMSAQPYQLYVPESYDGSKPYGLLIYLHGYARELGKENWVRLMYADVIDQYAEKTNCIMLMPFARSNTDFQGIGEDDVLRAIDEVKSDFSIDEDRVILGGYSMGGMGVWTIGGHYPHLFAGLWAMSSRSDFYMWKDTKPEEIAPFKRKLAEGEFGANMLENYSNLPMLMMHGSEDFGIPVGQSRTMYNRLKQKGMDVQYTEIEGEGHYFFYDETKPRPQAVKWLKKVGGNDLPKKFSFKTYNLKYDLAYWANLLGFEDWSRPARVSCELETENARIRLKTENVMALRIRPPGRLISQKQDLQIVWNGKKCDVDPQADGSFVIGSYPDEKEREKSLWKTPDLCGPVREAFTDPFIMVHAGQETPSYQLAIRTAIDWMRFAKGVPQVIPASEVTENLLKSHNLFLFGTPAENKLTRQIMPDLPITIGEKTIQVRDREYETQKCGFWMIYPNPLSPGNYVVLNAGIPWGQNLPYNHKYDLIPDFIVYTDEVSDEIEWCNKYLCAGFFDQRWQVSEKSIWFSKEPR